MKELTDKVQKIKNWISKEKDGLMDAQGNFEYPEHEGAYHILCNLDNYIDYLQEESVSEGERMRKQTLKVLNYYKDEEKSEGRMPTEIEECIAWLEKYGMPAKYHDICDTCVRQPTCQSDCFLQQSEQKPAKWSEDDDDDAWLNDIISKAECNLQLNKGEIDWLKSLGDRVKDNELTWEDIRDILDLYDEVTSMDCCSDIYGEVLKRFKEKKGKNYDNCKNKER